MLRMKISIVELVFLFGTVCAFSIENNVVEADESTSLDNEREDKERETPRTKAIPLGAPCDTNSNNCQCYGKSTFCGCGFLSLGSCICREGTNIVTSEKKSCPNKAEWENDGIIPTTPRPKSIPLGASCDKNGDLCQCYGKDTYCDCGILKLGSCSCEAGDSKSISAKHNCPNKHEWSYDEPLYQSDIHFDK